GLGTPPAIEVDLTEKNGKTQQLLVGDETPGGNGAYARLLAAPRVFAIPKYSKIALDKGAGDLRDKRLVTVDPNKISELELSAKGENIEFGRSKDQWQIVKPRPLRADSEKVDELVRNFTGARMDLTGLGEDEKQRATAFAGGSVLAVVKATDE